MNTNENRIAYFGTWGAKGHYFRPIRGSFSEREINALSRIDLPVFHDEMQSNGHCYVKWARFLGYAIPHSVDDKRPGCVSAIFVENVTSSTDIREIILNADVMLKLRFIKRLPKPNEI